MFASSDDSVCYFPNRRSISCRPKTSDRPLNHFGMIECIFDFMSKCIYDDSRMKILDRKNHILFFLTELDLGFSKTNKKILNNLIKENLLSMSSEKNRFENLEALSYASNLGPHVRLGAVADVLALLVLRGPRFLDDRRSILVILKLLVKLSLVQCEGPHNSQNLLFPTRQPQFPGHSVRQPRENRNRSILRDLNELKNLTDNFCHFVNSKTQSTRTRL